jgi:hypothetical protein
MTDSIAFPLIPGIKCVRGFKWDARVTVSAEGFGVRKVACAFWCAKLVFGARLYRLKGGTRLTHSKAPSAPNMILHLSEANLDKPAVRRALTVMRIVTLLCETQQFSMPTSGRNRSPQILRARKGAAYAG